VPSVLSKKNYYQFQFPTLTAGLLVQTLGSLWFFEFKSAAGSSDSSAEIEYKAHKLAVNALFWSLRFELGSRMFLASTKPQPHARHLVSSSIYIL
jgi:hypothetical protein